MRARNLCALLLMSALLLTSAQSALAQDSDRQGKPDVEQGRRDEPGIDRVDLAAIALSSDDVPSGFTLSAEAYTNAELIAEALVGGPLSRAEVEALDMRWYYQSEYRSADGETRIRSYAEEFGTEANARAGFELLEDESLFLGSGVSVVDKPGFDVGEEPSEVTVSTIAASDDAPAGASIDATFRVGRLLVGVAFDTISSTPPDETLLEELAGIVADRADRVLSGSEVPGIDPGLVTGLLSFDEFLSVQDGYVTLIDTAGGAAPAAALAAFESAYLRVVALNASQDSELPLPIVSVLISSFSSESAALSMISGAEAMMPPFQELVRLRPNRIPGTSAVIAFSFSNPFEGRSPDSYRIIVVVGSTVISVDVEGADSVEIAEAAALELLTQQLACIEAACGPANLPLEISPPQG